MFSFSVLASCQITVGVFVLLLNTKASLRTLVPDGLTVSSLPQLVFQRRPVRATWVGQYNRYICPLFSDVHENLQSSELVLRWVCCVQDVQFVTAEWIVYANQLTRIT